MDETCLAVAHHSVSYLLFCASASKVCFVTKWYSTPSFSWLFFGRVVSKMENRETQLSYGLKKLSFIHLHVLANPYDCLCVNHNVKFQTIFHAIIMGLKLSSFKKKREGKKTHKRTIKISSKWSICAFASF